MNQDQEHLRLLSIFHYIVSGIAALFACFPILHFIIGIVAIVAPQKFAGKSGEVPPPFFGWMFVIIAGGFILLGWTYAICLACAGRFLAGRKHYLFCLIIAGLSCLFFPFGTALGVFAIIVLIRPSVKEMFTPSTAGP
jgi:hypothetical protein